MPRVVTSASAPASCEGRSAGLACSKSTAVDGHSLIVRSFPLAEIVDAFRLQESGRHFSKIVVEY
ncbi:hypothetical protein FHS96_004035 [Sphingomonas zeicaulis]|uniref:hypothetical protein n=1 Tax=Sphingomonas zeicaulis TaxID=1632740 RepID=UPI003D1BBAA8